MKRCELCSNGAAIVCEADQAHLCWDCDHKVHSANFLVANHTRSLLCHVCQSPSTWHGSGHKLPLTVSLCDSCVRKCEKHGERQEGEEAAEEISESDYEEVSEDDEAEAESESEDEDDDDDDNQVVPWSFDLPSLPTVSGGI